MSAICIPATVSCASSSCTTDPTLISKMKSVFVFALFVAAVAAVPIDPKGAETVVQEFDNIGTGPFAYKFETNDGKSVYAEGQLKNLGTDGAALEVRGQYSYPGDDGVIYTITYIANENGFQPQGAHIP